MFQAWADPRGVVARVDTGEDYPYSEESVSRAVVVFPVEIKSVVDEARAVFSTLLVH
jgi:hypothetical protein